MSAEIIATGVQNFTALAVAGYAGFFALSHKSTGQISTFVFDECEETGDEMNPVPYNEG